MLHMYVINIYVTNTFSYSTELVGVKTYNYNYSFHKYVDSRIYFIYIFQDMYHCFNTILLSFTTHINPLQFCVPTSFSAMINVIFAITTINIFCNISYIWREGFIKVFYDPSFSVFNY